MNSAYSREDSSCSEPLNSLRQRLNDEQEEALRLASSKDCPIPNSHETAAISSDRMLDLKAVQEQTDNEVSTR